MLGQGARLLLLGLSVGVLGSCGDAGTTGAENPLPVLTAVSPTQIAVGVGATTLRLLGSGFTSASQARWNDADRPTHYRDSQTLTVDLLQSDVASVATGRINVVNPRPGGGPSAAIALTIVAPPHISAVSPSSVVAGSERVALTITGTAFTPETDIEIAPFGIGFLLEVTPPTQLTAVIPTGLLMKPQTFRVTAFNLLTGVRSNSVDFNVNYPLPTITATSPDSVFSGSPFTVTVSGAGFFSTTVVRWNGADRATTFVSSTRLTAVIPATDVPIGTTAVVSVFNPMPGGGESKPWSFLVRELPPRITGLDPAFITAGPIAARTVTVTGTNFRNGATVQWNGSNRPSTLLSGTSMKVTLEANDVGTPGIALMTVTNPGPSGTSNAMAVSVNLGGSRISLVRTIALTNADIVYDEFRGVIYASVPSTAAQYANSVVRIDPATGLVTGSVSVGSDPATLAITDDDQYLYVALLGAPTVVRVALATLSKDIDIKLSGDTASPRYAEDLLTLPGAPRTVIASTFYPSVGPRNAGTPVFDDATVRPVAGPAHTGSNRITRGLTPGRLFGLNNEGEDLFSDGSRGFALRALVVSTDGLHEEVMNVGLSVRGADIEYSGGYLYASTGDVVDLFTMSKIGTIAASGTVLPDATNARVHFLSGTSIRTFHYTSLDAMNIFTDPVLEGHARLIRWGLDGLAAGGGNSIVLVRGQPVAP